MFCPGCGTQRHPEEVHLACACGYVPASPTQAQGSGGADFVKTVASKFSVNQLAILGGCLLLLICMFLPFATVSALGFSEHTSGFALVFSNEGGGGPGFGSFLDLLLPLLVVACISVVTTLGMAKLPNPKLMILVLSGIGAYLALSTLLHTSAGGELAFLGISARAGVGLILFFIIWLVVTAAAYMEYKDIHLVKL